jgi:hypothetical protein
MSEAEHDRPLSAGTAALLEAWLRSRNALHPPASDAPSVELLVGYLCGTLAAPEARVVEQGLVAHPAARRQLIEARASLDALEAKPWQEVAGRAAASGFAAQVARAWLTILTERLGAAPRAADCWLTNGWMVVRRQVEEGAAEAQAAWSAFLSFCEQLRSGLRAPRLAVARGGERMLPVVAGTVPPGLRIVLTEAEVAADGSLRAAIAAQDASGRASPAMSGQAAHLALVWSGEAWPIAASAFEGARAAWEVPGLGAATGLPVGELPASYLLIAVGAPAPAPRVDRQILLAEVPGPAGGTAAAPAAIELLSEPRWQAGRFSVAVAVPASTRAAHSGRWLRLELVVSPAMRQCLGAWPLSEWGEDPRTLTASCPGSPDASLPLASFLRASLTEAAAA